jgi:hypothetical protein
MIMQPRLRKLALTAHVTCSVGWVGAVIVFQGLALIALLSRDPQAVRGAYLVMEPAAWFVLLPFALASLLTGLVSSLGTKWGLFRHYWVVFKLAITVIATVILLTYMETFAVMASMAADPDAELGMVRNPSPLLHASLALVALLVATVLGIYKPQGVTPYGWRKLRPRDEAAGPGPIRRDPRLRPRRRTAVLVGLVIALVLLFVILVIGRVHTPMGH